MSTPNFGRDIRVSFLINEDEDRMVDEMRASMQVDKSHFWRGLLKNSYEGFKKQEAKNMAAAAAPSRKKA